MQYKVSIEKRVFDLVVTSCILLFLLPLFLIVMIAIRLESKGPVFYHQPRVGMGYRIFPFFKFRSMYVNADKKVAQLKNQSQYTQEPVEKRVFNDAAPSGDSGNVRVSDDGVMTETDFKAQEQEEIKNSFFKVKNDPRITKVGKFIRKTSIDELPQLLNVLRGEMSLVGNRPLPLYEAEKLTEDKYIQRFFAPAGITGYWQVTDRGKNDVTGESRKLKDVHYAQKWSFMFDLWILLKTPIAAIQQENV